MKCQRSMKQEHWRQHLAGESPAMQSIADTIRLIAPRRSTVLITGETGTGKEVAARAIHAAGARTNAPFIAVNCAAIPANLMESELFGHVRGAFTGAQNNRIGYFEQANRGTLFLDEVGDVPLELQVKLLRVLQEREFQKVGSSAVLRTDIRLIAATNVNLLENVRAGKFREDLYYRLNVIPLPLPPLRERRSDIPLLVHYFLKKICTQESIPEKSVSEEALQYLSQLDWPGNVRQLENTVEMVIALNTHQDILQKEDFLLSSPQLSIPTEQVPDMKLPENGLDLDHFMGTIELSLLNQALHRANGNKTQAAGFLKLNRTTLTAKLKSLGAVASE